MRVPAHSYKTSDGKYLTIIIQNDRYWPPLCRVTGRERLLNDSRFDNMSGRVKHRKVLNKIFTKAFASETAAYWIPELERERIPFALVNDYIQALDDPQVTHRGIVRTVRHPVSDLIRVLGPPWIMGGMDTPITAPPTLGQHTDEILASWLGWSIDRIQAHRAKTQTV